MNYKISFQELAIIQQKIIKAAAHHIRESQKTSGDTEKSEFSKEQEAKRLTDF